MKSRGWLSRSSDDRHAAESKPAMDSNQPKAPHAPKWIECSMLKGPPLQSKAAVRDRGVPVRQPILTGRMDGIHLAPESLCRTRWRTLVARVMRTRAVPGGDDHSTMR